MAARFRGARRKTAWWGASLDGEALTEGSVNRIILLSDDEVHELGVEGTLTRLLGRLTFGASPTSLLTALTVRYYWGITCENSQLGAAAYDPQDNLGFEDWLVTGYAQVSRHSVQQESGGFTSTEFSDGAVWWNDFHSRSRRVLRDPCEIVLRVKPIDEAGNSSGSVVRGYVRGVVMLP